MRNHLDRYQLWQRSGKKWKQWTGYFKTLESVEQNFNKHWKRYKPFGKRKYRFSLWHGVYGPCIHKTERKRKNASKQTTMCYNWEMVKEL